MLNSVCAGRTPVLMLIAIVVMFGASAIAPASTVYGEYAGHVRMTASASSSSGFAAAVQRLRIGDVFGFYRSPAGRTASPVRISLSSEHEAVWPALDANSTGEAVAVWTEQTPNFVTRATRLEVATHGLGTAWSQPYVLSQHVSDGVGVATVGISRSGRVVVVWVGERHQGLFAVTGTVTGRWSQPHELTGQGGNEGLSIAIDDAGTALAVWHHGTRSLDQSPAVTMAAVLRANGTWAPAQQISRVGDVGSIAIALNVKGSGLIAWLEGDGKVKNGFESTSVFYRPISAGSLGAMSQLPDSSQRTAVGARWDLLGSTHIAASVDGSGRRLIGWSGAVAAATDSFTPQPFTAVSLAFETPSTWATTVSLRPLPNGYVDIATPAVASDHTATYVLWSYSAKSLAQTFEAQTDAPSFLAEPVASVPMTSSHGPLVITAHAGAGTPRLTIRPLG
jgi:hypothetical protein